MTVSNEPFEFVLVECMGCYSMIQEPNTLCDPCGEMVADNTHPALKTQPLIELIAVQVKS